MNEADGSHQPAERSPWGVSGALLGLAAAFFLLVAFGLGLRGLLNLFALDEDGVGSRYAQLIAFQIAILIVPLAAVLVHGAPWSSLGIRPLSRRGLLLSVLLGIALSGATLAYVKGLELFYMPGYDAMQLEQNAQLDLLAGPKILLFITAVCIAPLCEELFFRAYLFGGFRERLGFATASGCAAALFTLVHFMPWSSPMLFLVGLGAAAVYERNNSILAAIAMHATFNFCELWMSWLFHS